MSVTVEVHDLYAAYGERVLFYGLDVTIRAGTCTVVSGPNGSGKSTLLRMVCGLQRPTGGLVSYSLEASVNRRTAEERRKLTGYAGPDLNPYGELTALENLAFAARLRGVRLNDAPELLTRVGLTSNRKSDTVQTYSSGMRQRLRIALSLLGSPPVLVWDEPTAMLDAEGCRIVGQLRRDHVANGGTVLVASHSEAEILEWADQRIQFAAHADTRVERSAAPHADAFGQYSGGSV